MTGAVIQNADVVVVGGGPAGLAAAQAAAERGASVMLLDLFGALGGQYHMQPPPAAGSPKVGRQALEGRARAQEAMQAGVRFETGTEVFWVECRDPGFTIYAARGDEARVIESGALVVATGAMERPIPFKGWTLPGVMTAGAAQRLIKTGGIAPGRRVALAGSGPFLLAVAASFAQAGLPLAAFVEAARPAMPGLSLLARHPGRVPEALRLVRALTQTGAPRHFGWGVQEAIGDGRVEAVSIAPVGPDGRLDPSRSRVIEDIDTLCVGHGFKPVIDLTAALKADHHFDDLTGGWACTTAPETGATTVPGLYAAGETIGIGGAVPARLSGRLAGRHAAAHAGATDGGDPSDSGTVAALNRARSFAEGLAAIFPFPRGLQANLADDQIVCRCEDVRRRSIVAAIADGARDAFSVKMWTRAGMGPCQGRICGSAVAEILSTELGTAPADAGYNRPHLPLRPVALNVVESAIAAKSKSPQG